MCDVVKFRTPKNFQLPGLWFGPANAETVLIWVHGLGGSAFSHTGIIEQLVDKRTAVLSFSNRGSGVISNFWKYKNDKPMEHEKCIIGMAHEVFTECVDDIEGAVSLAIEQGAKRIILIGHSTGTQKSVYYLSKKPHPKVAGAILLAPMSDYADMVKTTAPKDYRRLVVLAEKMVATGKKHELMPAKLWPYPLDAQRFLSLHTVSSQEEIFTYASGKKPKTLQSVKKPMLVILAELDEYRERPMTEIAEWFVEALKNQRAEVTTIAGANHGFYESVELVASITKKWIGNSISKQ